MKLVLIQKGDDGEDSDPPERDDYGEESWP
jgi:hypothetical protein